MSGERAAFSQLARDAILRAVPEARGELLHYQQWNIDETSVVSFGAMAFRR